MNKNANDGATQRKSKIFVEQIGLTMNSVSKKYSLIKCTCISQWCIGWGRLVTTECLVGVGVNECFSSNFCPCVLTPTLQLFFINCMDHCLYLQHNILKWPAPFDLSEISEHFNSSQLFTKSIQTQANFLTSSRQPLHNVWFGKNATTVFPLICHCILLLRSV